MSVIDINNRHLASSARCGNVNATMDLKDRNVIKGVRFERVVTYINGLTHDVTLVDRNGLLITLENGVSANVETTNDLEVIVTYKFVNRVKIDIFNLLTEEYVSNKRELKILRDQLTQLTQSKARHINVSIKYKISYDMLLRNSNSIYVDDLDMVFSVHTAADKIPAHPYSEEGAVLRQQSNQKEFNFRITINDPHSQFGERFINLGGVVYRVPVVNDPTIHPGVYFSGNVPVANEKYGNLQRKQCYTFEEAEKLDFFYITRAEAETFGDPQSIHKREMDELKQQWAEANTRREQEFAQMVQKHKEDEQLWKERDAVARREISDKEQHLKTLELESKQALLHLESKARLEKQIIDSESAVRNKILNEDKYRMEQTRNRTTSLMDILKWIPLAITGVAGVVAVLVKVFK